jgi:RNA polymerase sigma factor (sigma-70 family)
VPTRALNHLVSQLRQTLPAGEAAGLTDGQLLEGFVVGRDAAALEALVRRHGPMVWGVCRRLLADHHDAEDAFQAAFLVLVRKAASIRSREEVANWLYGVARQTALKARATAARRRGRERQVVDLPEPAVPERDLWDDLRSLLDQELARLPVKYRVAILLCDVRGQARGEAARQLGLPEGTVASRLARGRAMLTKRLARRGIAPTAGVLAAVLARHAASAAVPPALLSATIKLAGSAAVPGVAPPAVAALTDGVLRAMLLHKLGTLTAAVLALGVLGFGGALVTQHLAAGQQGRAEAATGATPARDATPVDAADLMRTYRTNAALAAEKYQDRRFAVVGRMIRITGGQVVTRDGGTGHNYVLEMASGEPASKSCVTFQFLFADGDPGQKGLARLTEGQVVTVEGQCKGLLRRPGQDDNREVVYFWDSRLSDAGKKPGPADPAAGPGEGAGEARPGGGPEAARIQGGDRLRIVGFDTLPDAPINGVYRVEPEGTVHLGPAYGRVRVVGRTFEGAEAVILAHLRQVLKAPKVSVTGYDPLSDQELPPLEKRIQELEKEVRALRAAFEKLQQQKGR